MYSPWYSQRLVAMIEFLKPEIVALVDRCNVVGSPSLVHGSLYLYTFIFTFSILVHVGC